MSLNGRPGGRAVMSLTPAHRLHESRNLYPTKASGKPFLTLASTSKTAGSVTRENQSVHDTIWAEAADKSTAAHGTHLDSVERRNYL
ncbi:hypothetical protein SAMN05216228_103034 [Rhizobium tibeticum]|uniref:Uncharacterized protein n=1 Tax=Rhizobium tibeticum TaxID=501024 RepID=A0A1H8TSU5_9HYPH|nr:hypothetical protein RTCCBAU85039_5338 [Rhizobium tibeticum]SEO93915.1 hypothetical protein SAMN05216228_103034 [Rhizobium tibeticum]